MSAKKHPGHAEVQVS